MTIKDVVAVLRREKQNSVPSRFPCRAIMVKNISQYCELLSELKKINDIHFVQMQELFTNADVMPKYDNLKDEKYADKWLVLTGVSEYLRLFAKSEMIDRRFASLWSYQRSGSSTGRIIVPLWGCEAQWFDKALNLAGDLRQQDFFFDCTDPYEKEQNLKIIILSGSLEKYISKLDTVRGILKIGLQEWFDYWLDPAPDKEEFVLLTKRSNSVNTTNGSVSIHVVSDTLTLILENMPGASSVLNDDNCTDEMQDILLDYALKGTTLDQAILSILNMSSFSGIDAMGKWKTMSMSHKLFVQLWLKMHPDNTYLCHCFAVSNSVTKFSDVVMLEIFKVWSTKPEWVKEYRKLMQAMALVPNQEFFDALDSIPVYENRLDFMIGSDRRERIYLLRMVGKWLKTDRNQVFSSKKLERIFPELYSYLKDDGLSFDEEIKLYMEKYKAYKLENTLPVDESTYFNGVKTDVYDMRYTVLSDYIDSDTVVLWVDALGIEWFPLLLWTLSSNCDATIVYKTIVQATLPTETENNDQWKVMSNPYEKLDKLDKLAHKGVIDEPDYYACIQEQLAFVAGIHSKVSELLNKNHRVIITGDHGTSRLAARFFHKRDGLDAPKNAVVCSHGRYCKLPVGNSFSADSVCIVKSTDDFQYAVFKNYDHFKHSGFAAGVDDDNAIFGEVHGGAPPEEALVPIIVLDSNHEIPLSGKWETDTVKISGKKARFKLIFNKPVKLLQVRIGEIDGDVSPSIDYKTWDVSLAGIKQGRYSPQVYANAQIVNLNDVIIKPALGGGEGDLP